MVAAAPVNSSEYPNLPFNVLREGKGGERENNKKPMINVLANNII